MNLVADNLHTVAKADVVHALQLFACPYMSDGVVGIAEYEERGLIVGTQFFKGSPVDERAAVHVQWQFQHFAAVVADGREETVERRRLQQHTLAGHGERLDDTRECRNDARGVLYPFAADGPAVASAEPADDGVVVAVGHLCVAEDAVLDAFPQSLGDAWCRLEIHVGHPHGQDVAFDKSVLTVKLVVPLVASCAATLGEFVEIVFHVRSVMMQLPGCLRYWSMVTRPMLSAVM